MRTEILKLAERDVVSALQMACESNDRALVELVARMVVSMDSGLVLAFYCPWMRPTWLDLQKVFH